ncbi:MAG: AI-2E family transporter, partial [Candidatus Taylorbacteria bacterium]|nr:AI-2E family transporter [Candidatus Taylorbacteria bacterium]
MVEFHAEKGTTVITTGTIVRAILVVVGFVTIYFLRDLILVILTSVVIASALEPAIVYLNKRRIHRTISVLFIYAGVIALLGVLLFFLLPPLIADVSQLSSLIPQFASDPGALKPFFDTFPGVLDALRGGFNVSDVLPGATGMATGISSGV